MGVKGVSSIISSSGTNSIIQFQADASGTPLAVYWYPASGSTNSQFLIWGERAGHTHLDVQKTTNAAVINAIRQTSGATATTAHPMLFQIQDVPNATLLQPLRFTNSGDTIQGGSGGTASFNRLSGINFVGTLAATAGSGAVAGFTANNAEGFITVSVSGVARKIPYYNT